MILCLLFINFMLNCFILYFGYLILYILYYYSFFNIYFENMFQKNSKRTFTLYTSSNENGNNGKTGTELKSCLNTNKMLFPFSVPVFLSKQKREQLQNEKSFA